MLFEALIAKIYYTKMPLSAQALDSPLLILKIDTLNYKTKLKHARFSLLGDGGEPTPLPPPPPSQDKILFIPVHQEKCSSPNFYPLTK